MSIPGDTTPRGTPSPAFCGATNIERFMWALLAVVDALVQFVLWALPPAVIGGIIIALLS